MPTPDLPDFFQPDPAYAPPPKPDVPMSEAAWNFLNTYLGPHLSQGIGNLGQMGQAAMGIFGPQADVADYQRSGQEAVSQARQGNWGQAAGHAGLAAAAIPMMFLPGTASGVKKGVDGLRRYYGSRTWGNEQEARSYIRRRLTEENDRYAGVLPPTDVSVVDDLVFVRRGNNVGLSQRGVAPKRKPVEIVDSPSEDAVVPEVNWRATDLQDYGGTQEGFINIDALPIEHLAGGKGAYNWEDFSFHQGGFPPATIRLNRNGSVSIVDGNHRIAHWREQGMTEIPVRVIDKRGVKKGTDLAMDEASRMARARQARMTERGFHGTDKNVSEFSGPTWITEDPKAASYYAERARGRTLLDEQADNLFDEIPDIDEIGPQWIEGIGDPSGKNVLPLQYNPGNTLDMTELGDAPAPEDLIDWLAARGIVDKPDDINDWLDELRVDPNDNPTLWKMIEDWNLEGDIRRAGYDSLRIDDVVAGGLGGRTGHTSVLVFDPKNIRSRFAAFNPARSESSNILAAAIAAPIAARQGKNDEPPFPFEPTDSSWVQQRRSF